MKEQNKIVLFNSELLKSTLELIQDSETIWASQKQIGELFDTTTRNIGLHLQNIFETEELDENSVRKDFFLTAEDGKSYNTKHYNLDAILSVGYRVNSAKATQFRKWANQTLKDYLTKGFAINENLLNNSGSHFNDLVDKIQSLRASEKHVYEKLKECFKLCSVDYDPNSQTAKDFFSTIQNKFSYAITGKTSAEIIKDRANAHLPNMGLQTWKSKNITKSDATIAKNYLIEYELKELQHIVLGFIEMASSFALRKKDIKMSDWVVKLDGLINHFDYKLLDGKGTVSSESAKTHAETQYLQYKQILNLA